MNSINYSEKSWHFSHLGFHYFSQIANILGASELKNTPIKTLFIGHTGVPYEEKKKGRQVKPNWCAKLKDDTKIRYGLPSHNLIEPGLWNLNHCIEFPWKDIVKFYSSNSQ